MDESHVGQHLSPGKHAVKHVEMTVRRALSFIRVFDEWSDKEGIRDWRDIVTAHPAAFRDIYGDSHYEVQPRMEIDELWNRYKSGVLYEEVRKLAENVPMDKVSKKAKKEIERGLNRISDRGTD